MAEQQYPSTIIYQTQDHIPERWESVRALDWRRFWKKTHYPSFRQTGNDFNKVFSLQYTNIRTDFTSIPWVPPDRHEIWKWVCNGRYRDGGCHCHGCEHLDTLSTEIAVGLLSKINSCCRAHSERQKEVRRAMNAPLSLDRYLMMKERIKRGESSTSANPVPAVTNPVVPPNPVPEPPPRVVRTVVRVNRPDLETPTKIKLNICDAIECAICMDPDAHGVQLKLDDCGHSFCYGCATEWFNQNNSCPICRGAITRTEIQRCEDFMKLMTMYMF